LINFQSKRQKKKRSFFHKKFFVEIFFKKRYWLELASKYHDDEARVFQILKRDGVNVLEPMDFEPIVYG